MQQRNRIVGNPGYYGVGLAAAAAAASAVFFFDPRSGRRRRALVRDQLRRSAHEAQAFVGKAGRDARQRARGLYSASASTLRPGAVDDRILAERVRAELGRLTSHPGSIDVVCGNGVARLSGDILEQDTRAVLHGVARVRGVRDVVNGMRVHSEPGRIPALQGAGVTRAAPRFEFLQANWSPAPRLIAGAAGLALMAGGLSRRSASGLGLTVGGAALLARSICNAPLSRVTGVRTSETDGIVVQKTLVIYAEVDDVYACWRNLEGLPRFMSHIRKVRKLDDTHYHWVVDGPAGVPVEWDAEVTADVPGELIAWRTSKGSSVRSAGVVHFEPTAYGGTRLHLRLTYHPPANFIGHTVAKAFGKDPKHQIDADLLRLKQFLETGRGPTIMRPVPAAGDAIAGEGFTP